MNTQTPATKRLMILSVTEQRSIYQLPDFTKQEQAIYFSLNTTEQDILNTHLRGLDSKVNFILQLGYFRALFKFFTFTIADVQKDTLFILEKYFPGKTLPDLSERCNKKARLHHRQIIKTLYSYREVDTPVMQKLLKKAEGLLLKDANPKYIFKELHSHLNKHHYILPGYSTVQDLISRAVQNHERRIISIIQRRFTKGLSDKIDNMLSRESEHRYYLTLIKSPPNSFTLIQATKEREKRDFLHDIFTESTSILKEIGISQQSVKYYARLVDQFTIHRLQQLEASRRYFFILCFVAHRYLRINDALIKTMIYQITKFNTDVVESVKEQVAFLNIENHRNLKKGSEVLNLLTSDQFGDDDKIGALRKEAYGILSKNKIHRLAEFLKKADVDIEQLRWQQIDREGHKIRKNVRHIFKSTEFESNSELKSIPLYAALRYLQGFIQSNLRKMEDAPLGHIPRSTLKYLYKPAANGMIIDTHRYEILVYRLLKKKIDSSDIFVPHSVEYRSMESDLIGKTSESDHPRPE